MVKRIYIYIGANSDTIMLSLLVKPKALCCVAGCYATLMTTIISSSMDHLNETEGINNKKKA